MSAGVLAMEVAENEDAMEIAENETPLELPGPCRVLMAVLYNDYVAHKRKLISLITKNSSLNLVDKMLISVITRLDGLRSKALKGDRGTRGCDAFPEWYNQNRAWFMNEFQLIIDLVTQYNLGKPIIERAIMPLDNSKGTPFGTAFVFSGGKLRRTKRNTKKTKKTRKQTRHRNK